MAIQVKINKTQYSTHDFSVSQLDLAEKKGILPFLKNHKPKLSTVQQSAFIKSLLLDTPYFLHYLEDTKGNMIILDGKDYIYTIIEFVQNRLIINDDSGVLAELNGVDYKELHVNHKRELLQKSIRFIKYASSSIPDLFKLGVFK